ncbi:hypothetical protein DFJ58DRAFT_844469 [Suillus subalutaceus]|uniref:uncharacterized protein n=1 Tax=Suillus subalutaceus TaxID=48586 RepID=UPI001B86A14F|nr:uncharacterized protein DFJ58DRAFT_844469 [Suillus subalutaceus]KAG1843162.1 hypothetical protein DFJ58DRAFT_844469 [Suillus subalutaceus]
MPIDIARYSKLISPKDTGRNEEREEKLLERCPPGHEGTKLIDIPATILDASGAIIAWYLPDALTDATQNQSDPEPLRRPAAIATAALRVMHPEQYWAGLQAFASLGEKARSKELPKMSETLQYWATVFNSLTIICNQETPNHRDPSSISECFDILTSVGNYSNARMSMPSLQLELSGRGSNCLGMMSGTPYSTFGFRVLIVGTRYSISPTTEYRVSGFGTRYPVLDSRDSIFDFTDYRVPGFGFRYTVPGT